MTRDAQPEFDPDAAAGVEDTREWTSAWVLDRVRQDLLARAVNPNEHDGRLAYADVPEVFRSVVDAFSEPWLSARPVSELIQDVVAHQRGLAYRESVALRCGGPRLDTAELRRELKRERAACDSYRIWLNQLRGVGTR